jgi:hypothetical protein
VIGLGAFCVLSVGGALLWRLHAANRQKAALASVNVPDVPLTRLAVTSHSGANRHDR